jgi:uncharacterized protein (TIRG00374 family)
MEEGTEPSALASFRRWAAIAVALSALLYIGYAIYKDLPGTAAQLANMDWLLYGGVLVLTLVNYGLRYLKWHYLLGRLGVHLPHSANLWIFGCGLAMVISPAKAGEVVKPYLVRVIAGTPMQRTLPALVAERVTDGIAVVALATVGVTTFAPDRLDVIVFAALVLGSGFVVLLNQRLSMLILGFLGRIPVIDRVAGKLEEAYVSMRTCLAPVPLAITVLMSLAAWFAECIGLWLVYKGLSVDTTLDVATFLYAFSTTAGGFSPGGLGVTDVVLGELGLALIPTLTEGAAVAASLLIRVATLWFGVVLGAVALLRINGVIERFKGKV